MGEYLARWGRACAASALLRSLFLLAIYLGITYLWPPPAGIRPGDWRLFAVFLATVGGLILQPLPGGAVVLIGLTAAAVVGGLSVKAALESYSDPTVWLVMAAFFISRSLLNTGLARRIALVFVRAFGSTSLGVTYALALSDVTLATIIPSNGARSGGVTLPVVRSIAELYGSRPGETAGQLGTYLMLAVYQSICVSAAMFLTGQASNPLVAQMAAQQGFEITWTSWLVAGAVPGALSLAVLPRVVMWMSPPMIQQTPEARVFASAELARMGPMSTAERILAVIFAGVCGLWATSGWHKMDITLTALIGCAALLLTGVLRWEDVKTETAAWDIFIWYGGLLRLGKALNEGGVTTAFAKSVGAQFGEAGWVWLFAVALLVYFYAHYLLASITAHLLAMYPPFLALLVLQGAPLGLVVFAFACFTNFSAGLTNYGTTPSPMFFAHGYVGLPLWWRVGFVCSLVNIAIWSTFGFGWWKLLGIW